ncbi:hypothetical protein [Nonomuraea fuscirosea]|uniref:hypothetical protein n=1 Tax=Nonomuraea fuscirosea TaxID=1291556 RepID=UPI00340B3D3E
MPSDGGIRLVAACHNGFDRHLVAIRRFLAQFSCRLYGHPWGGLLPSLAIKPGKENLIVRRTSQMRNHFTTVVGALVALAVMCVISYAAVRFAKLAPGSLVKALLALAVVLGAIPALLYALYGS